MPYWRITAAYKPIVSRRSKSETPVYGAPQALSLCIDDWDTDTGRPGGIKVAISKAREWLGPTMTFDVRRFRPEEVF